ncbi:hypothetical protein EFR01_24780 [Sinorhizobium fredii]|nr:hypothetical protein EFR01_24780 [Sinorhizobium fredii]GLS06867.1 hypothetical protein GCM10007864_04930 [Sinorhizobium fredii]
MGKIDEANGTLPEAASLALGAIGSNVAMMRILEVQHQKIGFVRRQGHQAVGIPVEPAFETRHGKSGVPNRSSRETWSMRQPEMCADVLFRSRPMFHRHLQVNFLFRCERSRRDRAD